MPMRQIYTKLVPKPFVDELVKIGFDILPLPTYGEVLDWFLTKYDMHLIVYRMTQWTRIAIRKASDGKMLKDDLNAPKDIGLSLAMNYAIQGAIELVKKHQDK